MWIDADAFLGVIANRKVASRQVRGSIMSPQPHRATKERQMANGQKVSVIQFKYWRQPEWIRR